MRRSPLAHPLAVLRTTIGLTQKEMGALVNRAARTIQSIELRKLPLTEDLAIRIADATGVDVGWLLANDPAVPPRKGTTAMGMGSGRGEYRKEDFEFHRAFLEAAPASREQLEEIKESALRSTAAGQKLVTLPLPALKTLLLERKKRQMKSVDQAMVADLQSILAQTVTSESGDLVRWKIRQFFRKLAGDFRLTHTESDPAGSDATQPAAPTSRQVVDASFEAQDERATP